MIIDAHAHVYEYVKPYGPLGEGRAIGGGMVRWPDGTETRFIPENMGEYGFSAETLLEQMFLAGVDQAVLLQAQNYGYHNDYIAEVIRKYPGKFTGCTIFDPYARKAMDILRYCTEVYRFKIVKFELSENWGLTGIHPDLRLDLPLMEPFFEYAQKKELIIVIDTGERGTAAWQVEPIVNVMKKFPSLRFVLAHALFPYNDGFNSTRLDMLSQIAGKNCWFDISSTLDLLEPYPFRSNQPFLRSLTDLAGPEKIMWGSDLPGSIRKHAYTELKNALTENGLFGDDELTLIMGENARKLYF